VALAGARTRERVTVCAATLSLFTVAFLICGNPGSITYARTPAQPTLPHSPVNPSTPIAVLAASAETVHQPNTDTGGRTGSRYSVTFKETGLALTKGFMWSVSLGNTTKSSTESSITFDRESGTYQFNVSDSPSYYAAKPDSGSVDVLAGPITVKIKFTIPISDAFEAARPSTGVCSAANVTAHTCDTVGDDTYTLNIVSSAVPFGDVRFELESSTGHVFANLGRAGFSLVNISGIWAAYSRIAAGAGLKMTAAWERYHQGITNTTALKTLCVIVIDTGQSTPTTGMGLTFVARGWGDYSGSTSPVSLP
jgi:hypothetical protein